MSQAELLQSTSPSALAQHRAEQILNNWKLTPATLAFKLSNREVRPGGVLRWYPSPHLMYISLKIAQGIKRGNARIIVSAPPRHGKSKLCTHFGPTWCLENFEDFNVALVTYGADLSTDFAREVRDTINDNEDLLDVRLREDASRLARFLTNKNGSMTSIGIGGPFTGRGANVLFIDDYIKQIKEALSPTYREAQWDWFVSTAMTRLEPNASVVIIATRWHDEDLIGKIVKKFPDEWEYIRIPAIAEPSDVLGREPGEALFPQRFSIQSLYERRTLLGSKFFNALYQQQPDTDDGKYANVEWLRYADVLPTGPMQLVRVWDLASQEDAGDYTVGSLLGYHAQSGDTYLLNVIRKRKGPAGVEKLIQETAELDGPGVEIVIEREPGSSGKILSNHFAVNVLPNYKTYDSYSNEHKVVKAQPLLAACEAGHFILLKSGWNQAFKEEFEMFPNGKNDDQIDTVAIGYIHLTGKRKFTVSWGRKPRPVATSKEDVAKILASVHADNSVARHIHAAGKKISGVRNRITWGRN